MDIAWLPSDSTSKSYSSAQDETLHYTAGGPQIIQYLSEYKEEQPEGGWADRRGQTGSQLVCNWLH